MDHKVQGMNSWETSRVGRGGNPMTPSGCFFVGTETKNGRVFPGQLIFCWLFWGLGFSLKPYPNTAFFVGWYGFLPF